jgi:hypothetical protein
VSAEGDAAVLARLRSDPQLADAVFEGTVENPPGRYVSVFSPLGADTPDRFTGPSNVNTTTYTIHGVGRTIEQAKWVGRRVNALLKDWTPPVIGARRVQHPVSREPQLDRAANPPLWYVVDQYDLTVG